jgi:hypothetical protein
MCGGNRIQVGSADSALLFLYLFVPHALGLFLVATLARLLLHAARGSRAGAAERSALLLGACLGALIGLNALLRFPVTYGLFNSREQPFLTPWGLAGLLAFASTPVFLALGARALALRSSILPLVAWGGVFTAVWAGLSVGETPPIVDLEHASRPSAGTQTGSSAKRVALLGFDGLSWEIALALRDRGEMRHLSRALTGAAVARIHPEIPTLSPALWTTMATGRRPADHGVIGFSKFLLPGLKTPIGYGPSLSTPNWWNGLNRVLLLARDRHWLDDEPSFSTDRNVPAIWDLADHHAVPVGMVGWLSSWPVARPVSGGFRVAAFDGRVGSGWPPDARELPEAETPRPPSGNHFVAGWWQDQAAQALATAQLVERFPETRLLAAYFRFPDPIQHHAWRGDRWWISGAPALSEIPLDILASYRRVDDMLGTLLGALGEDTLALIVSDHGFLFDGHQHHRGPAGVFLASGPGVRPGVVTDITLYDVFPTLVALLRLPLSDEVPGRIVREVFLPGVVLEPPRVAAYDWYRPETNRIGERQIELEDAQLEAIRALGYVN